MKGQELHGDDAEDPLQAVDGVRQLDGLIRRLTALWVIFAAQDDGTTLRDKDFF